MWSNIYNEPQAKMSDQESKTLLTESEVNENIEKLIEKEVGDAQSRKGDVKKLTTKDVLFRILKGYLIFLITTRAIGVAAAVSVAIYQRRKMRKHYLSPYMSDSSLVLSTRTGGLDGVDSKSENLPFKVVDFLQAQDDAPCDIWVIEKKETRKRYIMKFFVDNLSAFNISWVNFFTAPNPTLPFPHTYTYEALVYSKITERLVDTGRNALNFTRMDQYVTEMNGDYLLRMARESSGLGVDENDLPISLRRSVFFMFIAIAKSLTKKKPGEDLSVFERKKFDTIPGALLEVLDKFFLKDEDIRTKLRFNAIVTEQCGTPSKACMNAFEFLRQNLTNTEVVSSIMFQNLFLILQLQDAGISHQNMYLGNMLVKTSSQKQKDYIYYVFKNEDNDEIHYEDTVYRISSEHILQCYNWESSSVEGVKDPAKHHPNLSPLLEEKLKDCEDFLSCFDLYYDPKYRRGKDLLNYFFYWGVAMTYLRSITQDAEEAGNFFLNMIGNNLMRAKISNEGVKTYTSMVFGYVDTIISKEGTEEEPNRNEGVKMLGYTSPEEGTEEEPNRNELSREIFKMHVTKERIESLMKELSKVSRDILFFMFLNQIQLVEGIPEDTDINKICVLGAKDSDVASIKASYRVPLALTYDGEDEDEDEGLQCSIM